MRKNEMRLTEQQYDEVLKQPIGTGIFIYHNAENEISQLQAKRTEVEVYRRATQNTTRKNNKAPAQANYEPLLRLVVVGAVGLAMLVIGMS
jgi:hypothetical protein